MTGRFFHKTFCAVALILLTLGGLTACNLFGKPAETSTQVPPPTETPLPALPTLTPTPTMPPTPTPTRVVEPTTAQQPTLTPTTRPTTAQVGGSEPVGSQGGKAQPVSYTILKAPVIGNVIANGSFEDGFQENGVGEEWTPFDNGGVGKRTYLEEVQPMHVSHGSHAQLMQLTGVGNVDRYIGIYQTVDVVAGETYTLSIHGLIRSSDAANVNVPYGHRAQWAIDYEGKTNWQDIEEWFDTGWNDIPLDKEGAVMSYMSLPIEAETDKLTLFIRGWTKWPMQAIAKFYVDGVFLEGPVPGEEQEVKVVAGAGDGSGQADMPTTGGSAIWLPIAGVLFVAGFALWEIRKTRRLRSSETPSKANP